MPKYNLLEEPLAVVFGQMLYLDEFDKGRFKKTTNWYRNDWINEYAQALYPIAKRALKNGKKMTSNFIDQAAGKCAQMQR